MNSHYVCRSCMRALLRIQARQVRDPQTLRRSLTTSALPTSEPSSGPNHRASRNVNPNHPSQFERSVDDDFLERLLAGRDPSRLVGLYSGARTTAGGGDRGDDVAQRSHQDGFPRRRGTVSNNTQDSALRQSTSPGTATRKEASRGSRDMDGLIQPTSAEGSPLIYRPYSRRQRVDLPPKFTASSQGRYVNSSLGLQMETGTNKNAEVNSSQHYPGANGEDTGSDLLDIFPKQRLVHRRNDDYVEATPSNNKSLEKAAERLVDNSNLTAQQSWDNYQRLFGHFKTPPAFLRTVQAKLIRKITVAWCENQTATVRPSEALYTMPFLTRAFHVRNSIVWTILSFITKAYAADTTCLSVEQHGLIRELLQVWFASVHRRGTSNISQTDPGVSTMHMRLRTQWKTLTAMFHEWRQDGDLPSSFKDRFRMFFDPLDLAPSQKDKSLDTAILVTFLMVHHYEKITPLNSAIRVNQPEFVELISSMMSYSDVLERLQEHKSAMQSKLTDGATNVEILITQLEMAVDQSLSIYAEARTASEARNSHGPYNTTSRRRQALTDFFQKRLERIIKTKQGSRVDQLFEEATLAFQNAFSVDVLPSNLFSHFLTAYMTFRRPSRAIEVWNIMVRENVEISVATWTAMLKGCGTARDSQTLRTIWQQMLSAGVKPDAQAWATLMDAYARCRRIDKAFDLFQEMAADWTRGLPENVQKSEQADLRAFGDIGDIPKPNTHCLNILVAHLIKSKDHERLAKLLGWAATLGIEVDAYTLNPLFSSALEDDDLDLAARILSQMHERGITPDMASFSLFISWFFRKSTHNNEAGDSQGQLMNVNKVFSLIENAGMGVNAYTFASLVAILLQKPGTARSPHHIDAESNLAAAYAILDYMTERSIPLSAQIYTTFISYHLKYQAPPDITAVDALWTRARSELSTGIVLDTMFYDRLIEGLAQVDQARKAMLALSQAARSGISPGWPAMRQLVLANLRAGETTRAAEVVEGVRREEGQAKDQLRADVGKKEFWRTCEHEGLGGRFLPIEESPVLQRRSKITST